MIEVFAATVKSVRSSNLSASGEPWPAVWKMNLTVDHSGNAVVKTLTLSLDAREPHGSEADYTEQKINV